MGGLVLGGHLSMADYYSVIALAVSRLPSKTDEARHGISERARTALQETLRNYDPPLSATKLANEQAELDAASCTVEVVKDIRRGTGEEARCASLEHKMRCEHGRRSHCRLVLRAL